MQKYVIALYIRLSIEDYKYDSLSIGMVSTPLFLVANTHTTNRP